MTRILVIGATSAIAEATARLWAEEGNRLFLVARNEERLKHIVADLKVRGAESVHYDLLDANDLLRHRPVIDSAITTLKGIDIVLIAYGTLGNQKACETDFAQALVELNTNVISVISILTHLANRFEEQKHGTIAVISSVAGDRGRESNYIYGTAKGAVSIFLQGLRCRLHKSGVTVVTIKPGFVDTPMTKQFQKGFIWASPNTVGKGITRAVRLGVSTVYLPWFWSIVMFVIKILPDRVMRSLNI